MALFANTACLTFGFVWQAFKVFDKHGTGMITGKELQRIMTTLGDDLSPEEVRQRIRRARLRYFIVFFRFALTIFFPVGRAGHRDDC